MLCRNPAAACGYRAAADRREAAGGRKVDRRSAADGRGPSAEGLSPPEGAGRFRRGAAVYFPPPERSIWTKHSPHAPREATPHAEREAYDQLPHPPEQRFTMVSPPGRSAVSRGIAT